jgi:adenylate kinase
VPKAVRVIAVTGTPGVGKSTFARFLAKKRSARVIDLSKLARHARTYLAAPNRRTLKIVDLRKLRLHLMRKVRSGSGEILVEGHLSHLLLRRTEADLVFVLRCHPKRLAERLRRKNWHTHKIQQNVLAEVLDICLSESVERFGLAKIAELDTTWWRPKRMVRFANLILDGQEPPALAGTDWLGTLAEAGQLERKLVEWSRLESR